MGGSSRQKLGHNFFPTIINQNWRTGSIMTLIGMGVMIMTVGCEPATVFIALEGKG